MRVWLDQLQTGGRGDRDRTHRQRHHNSAEHQQRPAPQQPQQPTTDD
jgi:hypothetical protein